jgi:hypothetical protein
MLPKCIGGVLVRHLPASCEISCARSYGTLRDGSFGGGFPRHFGFFGGVASIQKTISSGGCVYIRDKEISIRPKIGSGAQELRGLANREFCR